MSIQIKLKNSVVQDSTPSTSDLPAVGEIALNANINSIGGFMRASNNTIVKIFGPGSVSTPTATTTVSGIAELATTSETTTGTATNRVVTPAGLKAVTDAERATSNSAYMTSAGGTLTGALTMPNGSNSAAAINFGDSDSGIFGGTNTVSLTAGGTTRLTADTGVSVVGTLAVTGAITSTSDLTIAEKIIHSGDTDTFFSFPGDDIAAIDTGGSERLRVDGSGRVLYGKTSNRQTRLGANSFSPNIQIEDQDIGAMSTTRFKDNDAPFRFILQKGRGTIASPAAVLDNDKIGQILFSAHDGSNFCNLASIVSEVDGTPGANDMPGRLVFSTTADGANSSTDRLVIDSAGLVGIGTMSPSTIFEVQTAASERIQFLSNGSNEQPRIDLIRDSGTDYSIINAIAAYEIRKGSNLIYTYANDTHRFGIDGSEKVRIDSSGRLGIGTTSPNTKLDVRDSSATGISSRSTSTQSTDSNKGLRVRNNSDTDTFSVSYKGQGYFAGKVGIGISSPDSSLHVHKGSAGTVSADGNAVLALENNNHCVLNMLTPADKSAYIMFGDPNDINAGQIRYDNNINELLVEVNGSERLRIDDSGNVGIGTSSPQTHLVLRAGNPQFTFEPTANTQSCRLQFCTSDGTIRTSIQGGGSLDTALRIVQASVEKVRIDTSGRVGIGESSPEYLLHLKSTSPVIALEDTNTNAILRINADSSQGNAALDVDRFSATSTPSFIVNIKGSEKMRLTSAGHLGIGTSSPETPLSVDGGIRSTGVNPNISMLDTNASANSKRWDFKLSAGNEFVIQCLNDSGGGGGHLFKMTRSGNSLHTFQGQKSGATWFTVHNNDRKVTTYDLDVDHDLVITNQIRLPNGSAGTPSLSFRNSSNMGFLRHSSNQIGVSIGGASRLRFTNDHFSPLLASIDLGRNTSTHRFDNVFCVNLTESSDKNEKNTIATSDLGLDFINKLNPVSYKRNDGESGRTHYGLIAQEIETVISEINKTTKDFAGFVKTTHTEDGEGNTVDPYDCYALRYTEFISPIIKAIQELSTKVSALESA